MQERAAFAVVVVERGGRGAGPGGEGEVGEETGGALPEGCGWVGGGLARAGEGGGRRVSFTYWGRWRCGCRSAGSRRSWGQDVSTVWPANRWKGPYGEKPLM